MPLGSKTCIIFLLTNITNVFYYPLSAIVQGVVVLWCMQGAICHG